MYEDIIKKEDEYTHICAWIDNKFKCRDYHQIEINNDCYHKTLEHICLLKSKDSLLKINEAV